MTGEIAEKTMSGREREGGEKEVVIERGRE